MPTYEFRCPKGHEFEKFYRSIGSATGEVTCPVCGKVGARQLSAGGGLVFKGSGFYITDYGKDGKKSQTAAAAAEGGPSDAAASKPADGESTAKADSTPPASAAADAKPAASESPKPTTAAKPVAKTASPGKSSKTE